MDRFLAGVERRAFHMARLATGNADDALDIVQDAMLQLVNKYRQRSEPEWAPLFYQILQRRIVDWYRRNRVRNRWRSWLGMRGEDESDPLENLPDRTDHEPDRLIANRRTMAVLETAFQQLPLRQQQVFLLRAWEGLDVAATAQAMGCSVGSVKTHYSRAVHRLRELLGDHWNDGN